MILRIGKLNIFRIDMWDKSKYPGKSKYVKPSQLDELNKRTIENPDNTVKQKNRIVYEKDFKRVIGYKGDEKHTINRVVVEPKKKKIVTLFSTDKFKTK